MTRQEWFKRQQSTQGRRRLRKGERVIVDGELDHGFSGAGIIVESVFNSKDYLVSIRADRVRRVQASAVRLATTQREWSRTQTLHF